MANEMHTARESFLGIKVEATPGSDPGAFAAGDFNTRLTGEPSYSLNPDVHEVDSIGNDYQQGTLLGAIRGSMGFQTVLQGTGSSTVTTVPACALALKLGGMQTADCVVVDESADSGTPIPGETFTGGTSTETGVFIWHDSTNEDVYFHTVSGAFTVGETLTGGVSGATFTVADPSGQADYGCAVFPDETDASYKVGWASRTLGDATAVEIQQLMGCRGGWSLSHPSIGAQGQIDITVSGCPTSPPQLQLDPLPAVTYDSGDNVGFKGAAFTCGDATALNLLVNNLTISSGRSMATPANANATDNVGTTVALAQGRRFTASVDPLLIPTASYDYVANMIAGISGKMYYTIGTGAGNIIEVIAPKPVYTGLSSTVRDGARGQVMSISLDTTPGAINNEIYFIFR